MKKIYKTERQRQKAHYKSVAKYSKESMTSIHIRLHNVSDKQVIDKLNSVPNKTDYLRQLILADLSKEKES